MDQTELDLREIFYMLRRRIWLIVLVPVLAAAVAGLVTKFAMKPVYSASTTLWVVKDYSGNSQGVNYNDVMLSQSLTTTYAQVARSRAVLTAAVKALQLPDVSVGRLQGELTVVPVTGTQLLSFSVKDTDPELAAKLADAAADAFSTEIVNYMKVENTRIVDHAMVPMVPVGPHTGTNMAVAFVLGAMVALGLALLLEFLDTSIKTSDDIARYLDLPLLVSIPDLGDATGGSTHRRIRKRSNEAKAVTEK